MPGSWRGSAVAASGREKTRRRLAKTRRHMAMKRHDWQHNVSRRLSDAAGTVVIEDPKVRTMTRSARGTKEEPGRNVRAKAGLNRVILETGWSSFRLNAGVQGPPCRDGELGLDQPDLCSVRRHERPITQDTGQVSMRGLRPCGSCRPQCSGEHTGLGDWGICAGRLPSCRACEPRNRSKDGSMTLSSYRCKSQKRPTG